jgi:hypothetical protein
MPREGSAESRKAGCKPMDKNLTWDSGSRLRVGFIVDVD